ncbi:MAG: FAD-dependent oxidoreductase [Acidimicrobiales bacterium]
MAGILIEAESFGDLGGWVVDSQFELQMGSPYLLAHGWGRPVADARTTIDVVDAGSYAVWVRAKDWVPGHAPGRFTLSIGGVEVGGELGANGRDWSWEQVGNVDLEVGPVELTLHDLTGFDGRCDAIFLSSDGGVPVDGSGPDALAWRRSLRGLPAEPVRVGEFDIVVVGGGIAGCVAALTAARRGRSVALVQDRPYLGGNASKEIGLSPRGENGGMVAELSARDDNGDLVARTVLEAEPTLSLFLERRVYALEAEGGRIISIDVRQAIAGVEERIVGSVFIDTTGTAALGRLAGAEILTGREARGDFGEYYAPDEADGEHHGNTVFFRTRMADGPREFPDVPWATEVSKDYANLSGQLVEPGRENGPGPAANPDDEVFQFNDGGEVEDDNLPVMQLFPATHFWEYGQWLDLEADGELIRDHLLRALFGTFSNVKRLDPDAYANLEFDWVAWVPAQGEFRRYKGDYVLTENDIRSHTVFPDAVVQNDGAFCIHIPNQPGEGRYDFRLKDWVWDVRDHKPYSIPFRCLYSANVDNLMMAGKHISVTRVAGTTTKLMGNGGQHGAAVGVAASLCVEHDTSRGACTRSTSPSCRNSLGS